MSIEDKVPIHQSGAKVRVMSKVSIESGFFLRKTERYITFRNERTREEFTVKVGPADFEHYRHVGYHGTYRLP